MNKANVFLLVVVSSLLTYISTATQPAATATVAQEKWEYQAGEISTYDSSLGHTYNRAQFPSGFITVRGEDDILITTNILNPSTGEFEEVPYYSPIQIEPFMVQNIIAAQGWNLLQSSVEDGWEVFQVDDRRPGTGSGSGRVVYHLRRRVQ